MEQKYSYYTVNDTRSFDGQKKKNMPPKPESYLVWAIISISVCLPFGLLALMESIKVDSLYSEGEYNEAVKASENTEKWLMWCLGSCLALLGFFFLVAILSSFAK